MYTHPKVQDVQVIGVPSKQYGEEDYGLHHSQAGPGND